MERKIEVLTEKLKDERGKKVMFVSHCILNENTRYLGGAFRRGCVDELVDEFQKEGVGIVQMKCPEQKAWGGVLKKRILRVFGSRETLLYKLKGIYLPFFMWNTRRVYRKIAREVTAEIKDYCDSNFDVTGIVGVAGSPSCGVNTTLDVEKSVEYLAGTSIDDLNREKMNQFGIKGCLIKGNGLFIRALKDELKKENIKIRFYEHDSISEMNGGELELRL